MEQIIKNLGTWLGTIVKAAIVVAAAWFGGLALIDGIKDLRAKKYGEGAASIAVAVGIAVLGAGGYALVDKIVTGTNNFENDTSQIINGR